MIAKYDFNAVFMNDAPYTKEQCDAYNRYSFFDIDMNSQFYTEIQTYEDKAKELFHEEVPERVKISLYYLRRAVYNYYLEDTRASGKAPSPMVVGISNYKGNFEKAAAIQKNAYKKVETAKEYFNKAIRTQKLEIAAEKIERAYKIKAGDLIKVWWTASNKQYIGTAKIKKINIKSILMELVDAPEGYSTGYGWSIPIKCTKCNRWELVQGIE